jgi:hypothetical protein
LKDGLQRLGSNRELEGLAEVAPVLGALVELGLEGGHPLTQHGAALAS